MTDPLIDTVVAHYQVCRRLGGGAMGVVYKARDLKLGRHVALKFLPHEWSHDEDAKQRFMREAQAASSTDHPNICTIHGIQSTDDGRLFIVMAYYDGVTLKQRLARGAAAGGRGARHRDAGGRRAWRAPTPPASCTATSSRAT